MPACAGGSTEHIGQLRTTALLTAPARPAGAAAIRPRTTPSRVPLRDRPRGVWGCTARRSPPPRPRRQAPPSATPAGHPARAVTGVQQHLIALMGHRDIAPAGATDAEHRKHAAGRQRDVTTTGKQRIAVAHVVRRRVVMLQRTQQIQPGRAQGEAAIGGDDQRMAVHRQHHRAVRAGGVRIIGLAADPACFKDPQFKHRIFHSTPAGAVRRRRPGRTATGTSPPPRSCPIAACWPHPPRQPSRNATRDQTPPPSPPAPGRTRPTGRR